MYDPGVTSRIASRMRHYWSRTTVLSRDGWQLCRAMVGEIRGKQDQRLSDAFRNVLVTQARQSNNQMATSLLTFQQQIGLVQYHGVLGYLQQWRQKRLGTPAATSTVTNVADTGVDNSTVTNTNSNNNNVAQVAFMITTSMRQKLTDELGYEADRIKKMTPTDASLILHHKVSPDQVDAQLPGLIQQHEEEQERIQQEQQLFLKQQKEEEDKIYQEKQRQQQVVAKIQAQQESVEAESSKPETSGLRKLLLNDKEPQAHPAKASVVDTTPTTPSSDSHTKGEPSRDNELLRMKQKEGLYQLDPPTTVAYSPNDTVDSSATSSDAAATTTSDEALGSFVKSMEATVDASQQLWYEVVETRVADDSESPVALFSSQEEAEMVRDLKQQFADRRAQSDNHNPNNEPAQTYRVQTTLK